MGFLIKKFSGPGLAEGGGGDNRWLPVKVIAALPESERLFQASKVCQLNQTNDLQSASQTFHKRPMSYLSTS